MEENRGHLENIEQNAVARMNYVEGFNPKEFLVDLAPFGSTEKQWYMPIQARLLWFHLCYPEGIIRKKILQMDDKMVIIEAKIYANRTDEENCYLSSAWAQRYYDPSSSYGMRYIECAETCAEGRALGKAGFGSQYSDVDPDEPKEPAPVDTPAKTNNLQNQTANEQAPSESKQTSSKPLFYAKIQARANKKNPYQVQPAAKEQAEPEKPVTVENSPEKDTSQNHIGQNQTFLQESETIQSEKNQPESPIQTPQPENPIEETIQNSTDPQPDIALPEEIQEENHPEQTSLIASEDKISITSKKPTNEMSEDEINKLMTIEFARSVTSTVAACKGHKLGELMDSKPSMVEWIAQRYCGSDKMLKLAAVFLCNNKTS